MSLITEYHDSLPYIDPDPSPAERARVATLLTHELSPESSTTLHPSIPTFPPPTFTPLYQKELDRKAANEPLNAIDLSRYEAPEPPAEGAAIDEWRTALQRAYAASTHLSTRRENLGLLEENGKNAWLVSNAHAEEVLRGLERELEGVKEEMVGVNRERRRRQESGKGELEALEESWKKGVRGFIECEVRVNQVKREILERKRGMAQ